MIPSSPFPQEIIDPDLLAARLADVPGRARQGLPDAGRKEAKPQHRISLSADEAHREALVLVSIVTEGEGDADSFRSPDGTSHREKETRPLRWANTGPSARSGSVVDTRTGDDVHGRRVVAGYDAGRLEEEGGEGGNHPGGEPRSLHGVDESLETERVSTKDNVSASAGAGGGTIAGNHDEMRRRCLQRMEAAAGLGFEELRSRHVRDVEALFDRVEFSLGPSSEGDEESTPNIGSDQGVTPGPSSCVSGLPIRTRVSRSGKACTERGEESDASDSRQGLATSEGTDDTVVDDGLIELMYHYGRWVLLTVWLLFGLTTGLRWVVPSKI